MKHPLLNELRRRRMVEWMLAYVAGAILVLQIVDAFGSQWSISESAARGIRLSLVIGFFVALVVAWYHGPKGRQDPTGAELLLLTFILLVASLLLALTVQEPFRTGDRLGLEVSGARASVQAVGSAQFRAQPLRQIAVDHRPDIGTGPHERS